MPDCPGARDVWGEETKPRATPMPPAEERELSFDERVLEEWRKAHARMFSSEDSRDKRRE